MKIIFVVDDKEVNLSEAKRTLEGQYQVYGLSSAEEMFVVINDVRPDLILLDVDMPDMDGFTAINKLKNEPKTAIIPVIFMCGRRDPEIEASGLEFGASDFVTKPFSPAVLLNRVAHHLHIEALLKKRTLRLERLQNNMMDIITDMVESRDKLNIGHVNRTSKYIKLLVEKMKEYNLYEDEISQWDFDTIVSAARLHDIGKIAVSDSILSKPGRLSDEEFAEMKKHALEGEHIIEMIIEKMGDDDFLSHAKKFAGAHHEKWDGSGYPRGLQYEAIPLHGRMMAIADVYDALVTPRPYKSPMSHEEAVYIIREEAGRHFDPQMVDIFCDVADKFEQVTM